ncbi:MAG: SUMF1/EgtB/PvdO family nonheme iron enzyme [Desulfobacterales bacterium]|nr:SUMF1/EgtB/PvdO family nonheme iron enzyme [Desulfobacterales bacterium]
MTGIRIPLALMVLLFCAPAFAFAPIDQRLALVIGNGAYRSVPLKNPVNDATDVAAKLEKFGFRVVLRTDVGRKAMEGAIRQFGRDLLKGGLGLFYFAGHGMQVDGRNYLIPVDAQIETESDVRFESVDAGRVLGKMEDAQNGMNIVILDACRDNPFARSARSGSKGLARMDAPRGSIIAYATAPGAVAADGFGRNGIYTKHLLANIDTPGLSIETVFKNVRIGVIGETGDKQVPWESSSLTGDFSFSPKRGLAVVAAPAPVSMRVPAAVPAKAATRKSTANADKGYHPAVTGAGQEANTEAWERSTRKPEVTNALGMAFAFVPPGSFMMGSPAGESGRDADEWRHRVTLTRGFFMQTTEVTQRQWEAVMGVMPADFQDCGADCPVEMVSWNDAMAFIDKLNRLEGGPLYRLPTEAEWEYTCRSGESRAIAVSRMKKVGWYRANTGGRLKPVGGKRPNAWGIYDMHGNVYEWCQDRFGPYGAGSDVDPAGPDEGLFRVFRGGAWVSDADACRAAARNCHQTDFRGNHLGLRLIRNP